MNEKILMQKLILLMNKKYFYILSLLLVSSCSNILTWHLDKGIHKNSSPSQITKKTKNTEVEPTYNISSNIVWSTSVNGGIYGNTAYMSMVKDNNILYSVDTDGLISAVSSQDGSTIWQVPTNYEISSGPSVLNDKICVGTMNAKLACFDINSLATNSYIPLISYIQNSTTFSEASTYIEIDLITELASPIQMINNLFLLKLDNDDLYLIDSDTQDTIWKSESQNIPLRTKGASKPKLYNNSVLLARDNGSIASYNQINGTLEWFTIISSRSGRNDLESQRDAEMDILIQDERLFYGHYQGDLASLDIRTGDIIWSSPFSFINNLTIKNNSIFGSTTDNMLVSLDQASGFLNWKVNLNESVTEPFVIGKTVMVFSVTGILYGYNIETGNQVYKMDYGYDLHTRTQFIKDKNIIYFQTTDGDIICLQVSQ